MAWRLSRRPGSPSNYDSDDSLAFPESPKTPPSLRSLRFPIVPRTPRPVIPLSPSIPEAQKDKDNDFILRTPPQIFTPRPLHSPTPSETTTLPPSPLRLPSPRLPVNRHLYLGSKPSLAPVPKAPAPPVSRTAVASSSSARGNQKPTLVERIEAHKVFLKHKQAVDKRIAAQRKTIQIAPAISRTIDRTVNYRQRHQIRRIKNEPIECKVCQRMCPGRKQYEIHLKTRRHLRLTGGPTEFTCETCGNKKFFDRADFQRHIQGRKHRNAVQLAKAK